MIGRMRDRAAFFRLNTVSDAYGNPSSGFAGSAYLTRWGKLQVERGQEKLEAGRLESSLQAVLKIRSDTETRTITAADKVEVDGEAYQIRSISNPDRRERFLELHLERGVGV